MSPSLDLLFRSCAAFAMVCLALSPVRTRAQDASDPLVDLQASFDAERFDEVVERGREMLAALHGDPGREAPVLDLLLRAAWKTDPDCNEELTGWARRAVEVDEVVHGDPDAALAASVHRLGLILLRCGEIEAAREQFARALAMRREVLDPADPEVAKSASELANALRRLGRYAEAVPLFEEALEISELAYGPDDQEVAKVLHNTGNNFLRLGDYPAAREAYDRALAIKQAAPEPDDASIAITLITRGVLLKMMGDYDASAASYARALEICETSLGDEHRLTLAARNNYANLLNDTGRYEEALPLYERTLELRIARLGPGHPEVADTEQSLGVLLLRAGEPELARPHFEAAVRIWETSFGPDHPHLSFPVESLANIALCSGDVATALPLVRRALGIRTLAYGPDHPETGKSHLQLASALLQGGDRPQALAEAVVAATIFDRHLRDTIATLPEREALALVAARSTPESVLFEGLRTSGADREDWARACWNWTLRRRGLVQEELAWRSRTVLESGDTQARQVFARYEQARAELGAVWVEGPGEDGEAFSQALDAARAAKESAEVELARVSREFRRQRQFEAVDVEAVRDALEAGEILAEIVRVEVGPVQAEHRPIEDFALLLGPDGMTDFVKLGAAAEIDASVTRWRTALEEAADARARSWESPAAMARLDEAGRALRRLVFDPIGERIDAVRTLYWVPEASLHLVDPSALALDDGRYLVEEDRSIRLLDSGRDLVRFRELERDAREGAVLALGDVDFDAIPGRPATVVALATEPGAYRGPAAICEGFASTHWPALPESRVELEAVRAALDDVVLLTGADASEARLREAAPGMRVLHLATHGFFLQGACVEGAAENPLLLSGLVLAGANRVGEGATGADDGIATAEELAALDLRGVELVVLSACDTGRGEVAAGEGVFGLRRAFAIAGAPSIVMSLWPTPDDSARAWMSAFYGSLDSGVGVAEAARSASRERLRILRQTGVAPHPELWAGFVCAGDWR